MPGDSNHATRRTRVPIYLSTLKHVLALSHSPPSVSSRLLAFVFLIPWRFTPLGGLDFVACWPCLAASGFTTRGCDPLTPKAPIMMGGALPLASVEEARIFPMRVCTAEKISKVFSGNEGAEWTRWTQEPSLIQWRSKEMRPP